MTPNLGPWQLLIPTYRGARRIPSYGWSASQLSQVPLPQANLRINVIHPKVTWLLQRHAGHAPIAAISTTTQRIARPTLFAPNALDYLTQLGFLESPPQANPPALPLVAKHPSVGISTPVAALGKIASIGTYASNVAVATHDESVLHGPLVSETSTYSPLRLLIFERELSLHPDKVLSTSSYTTYAMVAILATRALIFP